MSKMQLEGLICGLFYETIANLVCFRTVNDSILFESQATKHMQTSFHNPFFISKLFKY